jgi:hypothetical protein
MSLARFQVLTDAYGASAMHWPAAERDAARRLLAGSGPQAEAAREALASASALDALLMQDAVPAITAQEVHDVLATFQPRWHARWTARWAPSARWRRARVAVMTGVMALSGMAGMVSGTVLTSMWFPANAATVATTDGRDAQSGSEPLYRGTVFGVPTSDWSEQ